MQKIIVSDIFGNTPELEHFASLLAGGAEIVDPYQGTHMRFADEQSAYTYFSSNVGLESYTDTLNSKIDRCLKPISLLGFSIGASAIWLASSVLRQNQVSGAALFYSSQIRHHLNVVPNFPVSLLFPKMETHFSVLETMSKLKTTPNVTIWHTKHLHGFMNSQSKNFDEDAYTHFCQRLHQQRPRDCFSSLTVDRDFL